MKRPMARGTVPAVARCAVVVLCLAGCSDGATRIAYQIESEVADFERSHDSKRTITHQPIRRWGNGCDEAYRLQVDRNGAIIIWCKDGVTGATTGSHSTSYHARFVDSPQTWIVDKKKGETVAIELEKKPGSKPQVVAVR